MDAPSSLMWVGFIVLSVAALLIWSMLGIKEKTYDEAIAEQRKLPDDALLFRRPNKPKSKDKKPQRSGKKVKEKKPKEVKQSSSDEFEEPVQTEPEPVHVKINSEPEVLGETVKPEPQKKKKKDKVKPILVHKEEHVVEEPFPPALANHFDLIQPKDDLSLRKLSRGEAALSEEVAAVKQPEAPQVEPKVEKVVKVEAPAPVEVAPVPIKAKEKKKSKNKESNMGLLTPALTLQQLSSLILAAELSPNERQILTDLLLNEHQDDHSEWSEDMQMAKLKKQLAEKETALANEMASSQAFQSKLKELRNELNEEKSKCRQFEEGMMSKHNDVQTLQARIVQQNHERQNMVKEMQALQVKMNEDKMVIRSLQESNQAQVSLQQEIHNYRQQISQMDVHMSRLSEAESNLKAQLHALSTTYAAEQQKNRALEEDLRDALGKLDGLKESNASRQELARKLEELEREKKKLEEDVSYEKKRHATEVKAIRADAEKDALYQQNRLQAEIHTLTNKISALQSEAEKYKSTADKLKLDSDRQKMEREKLGEDMKNLQNECERLQTELTAATSERTAGDGRENGGKDLNTDFINHEMESKNKDIVLEKLRLDLESSGKTIEKLKSELSSAQMKLNSELKLAEERFKTELNALKDEIESLKTKNNDLRQKNYKAMDALSSTEKALEKKVLETDALVTNQNLVRAETESACTALLSRLLPEVKVDKKDFKEWLTAYEASATSVLAALRVAQSTSDDSGKVAELERQVTQLDGMVAHYKTIIEETEGMLNRLQSHVEAEELRWRESIEVKQNEIDGLKNELASLNSKVNERDAALDALRLETGPLAKTIEENENKLRELCNERDALKSQLSSEQDRLKEVNKELVKVRSNLKIGRDAFEAEQKLRQELEDKLNAITCKGEGNGEVETLASESVPLKLTANSVQEAEIPKKKKKKKKNGGDPGN